MYEIERKFLVHKDKLPKEFDDVLHIKQGYLFDNDKGVVRIRKIDEELHILTIKMRDEGIRQVEIEKDLSKEGFDLLWTKIDKKIVKIRCKIGRWEVDFFANLTGVVEGLILAEIELEDEDEEFELPEWIEREVTGEYRYFNSNLAEMYKKENN